jgi:hypothetical protein
VIPPIPDTARRGFSRDLESFEVARQYWTNLFSEVIQEADLNVDWLHTGSPTRPDISGSTIFSARSFDSKRGIIVDQEDSSELRDGISWYLSTWDPQDANMPCLHIRCFLGPTTAKTALDLARRWFIDRMPQPKLIDEFRDTYVG